MSSSTPSRNRVETRTEAASRGIAGFAGVMLIVVSVFQILQAIAAIAKDDVYVTGIDYVYQFDVTAWGWIHLTIGVLGGITGAAVVAGKIWGMVLGIFIAVLSMLANFAFVPYYPLWSLTVIAFDIIVMWALFSEISKAEAGPPLT